MRDAEYYDPWGNDAIWLQYDQAAFTMGHTGLLLQDSDGAWFLFYWGTSHTLSVLNPFKNQELIPKQKLWRKLDNYEFDTENPLSSVQIYLESMTQKYIDPTSNRNLSSGITDALYFEGDFTESVKYLNEMIGSMADQEALYNLYTNNCLQVSMDALAKGTFDKHNKYYQYAIQYARASLIPNDAFRGMRHFANTIDEYMRMSTWQKLVSATPYAYFNNFSKLLRGFPWLFG